MESARIKNLRERAEAGNPDAQYDLGCVYYDGDGVERNYDEALKWYRVAAAQNHNSGLCDVGFCYRNGHGVEQDYAKAIEAFERAMELNPSFYEKANQNIQKARSAMKVAAKP